MTDPSEVGAESPQKQIGRSLGSLWESHCGDRPSSVNAEILDNVVTCEIEATADTPSSSRYRNDAMAAVTRITGRRVTAFIPKPGTGSAPSTEKFVLAPRHIKR
jgi:hypothetical protein